MVSPNSRYAKDENVVTRKIAGETIIVPIKRTVADLKAIFTLNEMAGVIWERIDGHTSVGALISSIYREFRVAPEEVIRDVVSLLTSFEDSGLIHSNRPVSCVEERK